MEAFSKIGSDASSNNEGSALPFRLLAEELALWFLSGTIKTSVAWKFNKVGTKCLLNKDQQIPKLQLKTRQDWPQKTISFKTKLHTKFSSKMYLDLINNHYTTTRPWFQGIQPNIIKYVASKMNFGLLAFLNKFFKLISSFYETTKQNKLNFFFKSIFTMQLTLSLSLK